MSDVTTALPESPHPASRALHVVVRLSGCLSAVLSLLVVSMSPAQVIEGLPFCCNLLVVTLGLPRRSSQNEVPAHQTGVGLWVCLGPAGIGLTPLAGAAFPATQPA